MANALIGLYDDRQDAEATVQDLVDNKFDPQHISLATGESSGYSDEARPRQQSDQEKNLAHSTMKPDKGAGIGAGIGAGVGGLSGLLVGLGTLTIPGVGAAVVAGPLIAALSSAVVGAAGGGMLGALVDLGVSTEEAGFYAEGVRRGGTLVVVDAPGQRTSEALTILQRHNPVSMNERMARWRAGGWTGYDVNAEPYTAEDVQQERQRNQDYTY